MKQTDLFTSPGLEQVVQQSKEMIANRIDYLNSKEQTLPWPDPTKEQLNSLWFNQIWEVIKDWDINGEVAQQYHVVHILNSICPDGYFDENEQWK
jgi:hypothetical protein